MSSTCIISLWEFIPSFSNQMHIIYPVKVKLYKLGMEKKKQAFQHRCNW